MPQPGVESAGRNDQPAQGPQAESGFAQQPGLVAFRKGGRDAVPPVLEEAGDCAKVGPEGAELLGTVELAASQDAVAVNLGARFLVHPCWQPWATAW